VERILNLFTLSCILMTGMNINSTNKKGFGKVKKIYLG
jgi:hypothetical protein